MRSGFKKSGKEEYSQEARAGFYGFHAVLGGHILWAELAVYAGRRKYPMAV